MSQTTISPNRKGAMIATAFLLVSISSTFAATETVNIPVRNWSFELPSLATMGTNSYFGPIDGWTGVGGVELVSGVPALVGTPHDGVQVAYVNPAGSLGYLEQNVGPYDPKATYDLGYLAAVWWDVGRYNVSLLVGGSTLASYTSPEISYGSWDNMRSLTAPPNPSLSGDLYIRLSYVPSGGIGNEREFDNITLLKTTAMVPEPGMALLFVSGFGLLRLAGNLGLFGFRESNSRCRERRLA